MIGVQNKHFFPTRQNKFLIMSHKITLVHYRYSCICAIFSNFGAEIEI